MDRRVLISAAVSGLAFAGCSSVPLGTPSLVGRWAPVSAQLGGRDIPISNYGGAVLQLTPTTYSLAGDEGTYVVLPGTSPPRMDLHGGHGPNSGKNIPAIYRLEGDQLTVCYQLGNGERPKVFASQAGSQVLLVQYRRVR